MNESPRAFYDTYCDECGDNILEGEYVYFNEGQRFCADCAKHKDLVCPKCGGKKKPTFGTCFPCWETAKKTGRYDP